ncbi:hypothetical protein D6D01_02594 [Aureobasidium pullulans]|uniref:MYND-type domain-containing protein n=1 Tax=Aureobasidium pullulans TaxID=5580 RepID=A0A4S9LR44_AURPU|nr:hypothetical protein D6D01_02594 [Aureobasidium pullulans]
MLTPTVVDLAQGHFYPFGNTPAVNFLRDYRPSNSDNVDILALGCGDARNLLFSLWSEHKGNGCKFNFTVCDLNPAVSARNIFLLSAIQTLSLDADDADHDLLSRLWRIYYHLFITQDDLTFVQQHPGSLAAIAFWICLSLLQYALHLGFRTQVSTANLYSNHVKIFARAPIKAVSAAAQPPQDSAMCIDSIDDDFQVSEEKPASEISNKGSDGGPYPTTESAETISWMVQLKKDCTVHSITATKAFAPNSEAILALKKGTAIKISRISPCVMELSLEQLTRRIAFTYLSDGMKAKLTRHPVFIELSAPTSNSIKVGGYPMNPFPVIDQNGTGDFLAWGMGRVDIDRQPLIKLPVNHLRLEGTFATASTRADRALNLSDMNYSRKPAMLKLREGLPLLFTGLVGLHPRFPGKTFRLYVLTEGDKVDAFIISNAIHHDRDSGSIFLDAFVVPLNPREMILWKHLTPATVERCRAWEHKETCEYKINTTNTIPLSTAAGKSPICTCGNGQNTNQLPPEFKPLAAFATRIAIPIIHVIPYMVAMMLDKLPNSTSSQTPAAPRDICGHCGGIKLSGLKACTRCEKVKYCNHACQKAAWKEHKKVCKR